MTDVPYVFVKNRPGQTYKRSVRIVRYWKHKVTGNIVEIRRMLNDVDRNQLRVVFFDPTIGKELCMPLHPQVHPFQPPGAPEVVMEPSFEDHYEPYGNFTSRA
jgi:hypothetical protein